MNTFTRSSFRVAMALLAAFILALFVSAPGHAEIHCAGGHCNCSGDKDCNTMFTSLCTDTGGSCNNDNNTCTCTQKAKAATGSLGGTKVPQAGAIQKNTGTMKKY
ncbi:MAG: hypothetical protein ACRECX_14815 [Methyloceanibacter sp.]|uniref:hypothetical protein n=1 Tax=Methyloceanibacter sp. TaxID=1965321 RepID=UPI003D6D3136